jgi:hypothetical protein
MRLNQFGVQDPPARDSRAPHPFLLVFEQKISKNPYSYFSLVPRTEKPVTVTGFWTKPATVTGWAVSKNC